MKNKTQIIEFVKKNSNIFILAMAVIIILAIAIPGVINTLNAVENTPAESSVNDTDEDFSQTTVREKRVAGIVAATSRMEATDFKKAIASDLSDSQTENSDTEVNLESGTDSLESIESKINDPVSKAASEWKNRLMADVDQQMNVREEPTTDSGIVGRMRKGDVAEIIEAVDGWYKITSGNVEGYVSADYVVTGDEAYELALDLCTTYAEALTGGLRIREGPSTDSAILSAAGQGDELVVDTSAEPIDGWVAVHYKNDIAYVSADYVDVETEYSHGITIAEENAIAEAEAKKKEEAKTKQVASSGIEKKAAVSASYDELTILAALIQIEAGHESYLGQLAVGAVVMNRIKSPYYPNNLVDVIYQRGQFSTGRIPDICARGPMASCMTAAIEASKGSDNVSGFLHFKSARSGQPGILIGNQVFY